MEDVHDMIRVLFPECDICMEIDHSSGHGMSRANGLNADSMNKGWGGKQGHLRSSVLTSDANFGPFPATLKKGDTQSFDFVADGPPPHFDSGAPRQDAAVTKAHKLTKAELVAALRTADPTLETADLNLAALRHLATGKGLAVTETRNDYVHIFSCEELGVKIKQQQPLLDISFLNSAAMKKLAAQLSPPVPLSEVRPLIQEGWVGKPKGLLQILCERGWIDPSKVGDYYMDHNEKIREEEA
jgi:hypothetical protein